MSKYFYEEEFQEGFCSGWEVDYYGGRVTQVLDPEGNQVIVRNKVGFDLKKVKTGTKKIKIV